jgi:hypothetical protein
MSRIVIPQHSFVMDARRASTNTPPAITQRYALRSAKHAPRTSVCSIQSRVGQSVQKWAPAAVFICLLPIFGILSVNIAYGAQGGSLAALDKEYGFGGIHFGAGLEEIKGAKLIAERGVCEKDYVRPTDRLDFGGVPLTSIEYSLQNGRFTVVSLMATAKACPTLYQALVRAYGEDTSKQASAVASQPFWTATWTGQRVRLDLVGPTGCTVTITAPEEAILEERQCREDDRMNAGKGP